MSMCSKSRMERYPGLCDICGAPDQRLGHNMQKCQTCGILVHEACYGLRQTRSKDIRQPVKKQDWRCLACSYAEEHSEERPHVCVLCSVSDGVHAMHPLYDGEGRHGGKQIVRRSGPAWVHTLCAMLVGSHRRTKGCVYACDEEGNPGEAYDISDEFESEEEHQKFQLEQLAATATAAAAAGPLETSSTTSSDTPTSWCEVHHFVICGPTHKAHKDWYKVLKEYRHHLRCSICKRDDSGSNVLRVPLQCSTGDDQESPLMKPCHKDHKTCVRAMHVGCAQWKKHPGTTTTTAAGKNQHPHPHHPRRVYFWPGSLWEHEQTPNNQQDQTKQPNPNAKMTKAEQQRQLERDPIAELYCSSCSNDFFKRSPASTPPKATSSSSSSKKSTSSTSSSAKRRTSTKSPSTTITTTTTTTTTTVTTTTKDGKTTKRLKKEYSPMKLMQEVNKRKAMEEEHDKQQHRYAHSCDSKLPIRKRKKHEHVHDGGGDERIGRNGAQGRVKMEDEYPPTKHNHHYHRNGKNDDNEDNHQSNNDTYQNTTKEEQEETKKERRKEHKKVKKKERKKEKKKKKKKKKRHEDENFDENGGGGYGSMPLVKREEQAGYETCTPAKLSRRVILEEDDDDE